MNQNAGDFQSGNKDEKNVTRISEELQDYFSPKIIGEVNDVYVKVTKTKGQDVPWHSHDNEDEMFYILKGNLVMELENDASFELTAGEFFIVPKGTRHRVYSNQDCFMMLIEPKSTKHTGDVQAEITKSVEEQF